MFEIAVEKTLGAYEECTSLKFIKLVVSLMIVNDNPSLTIVNDDLSLTIVKIIVDKQNFKNDRFFKNNRIKNGRKSF